MVLTLTHSKSKIRFKSKTDDEAGLKNDTLFLCDDETDRLRHNLMRVHAKLFPFAFCPSIPHNAAVFLLKPFSFVTTIYCGHKKHLEGTEIISNISVFLFVLPFYLKNTHGYMLNPVFLVPPRDSVKADTSYPLAPSSLARSHSREREL